jgi:endoglucanase
VLLEIASRPSVLASFGRARSLTRQSTTLLAIAGVLFVAACSGGDGTTAPTADARSKPVDQGSGSTSDPTASTPSPAPTTPTVANGSFYVDPSSDASKQAAAWSASRPADASQMQKLAARAVAKWFGDWNTDIFSSVSALMSAASSAGTVPVLVAYDIPQRDCGGFSSGGTTVSGYKSWIGAFASALAGRKSVVILEPDAVAGMDCLSAADQQTRIDLLQYAIQVLKSQPNVKVYLDAGNPAWIPTATIAARLSRANVSGADGFSLNVSNFITTAENVNYGQSISALLSGKHFVIDTSRNGVGATSDKQWCNPSGRALGNEPTSTTLNSLVDAFLWIKVPGQSDGACNGGPAAGQWWGDYALGLVSRSTL